jgi:hypothetical protein
VWKAGRTGQAVAVTDEIERTADGHHIVVNGRRWRASDPAIPDQLRQQLVDELMAARRAVRTDGDGARARVHDAKVALGERGEPWWEDSTPQGRADRLAAATRALLRHRRPEATICPSDVARVVGGGGWRAILDDARSVISELRRTGTVRVTQKGQEIDPDASRGPIRVARGPAWPDEDDPDR